jgi:hypothetical protein
MLNSKNYNMSDSGHGSSFVRHFNSNYYQLDSPNSYTQLLEGSLFKTLTFHNQNRLGDQRNRNQTEQ